MDLIITEATKDDIPELTRIRIEYMIEAFDGISMEEKQRLNESLPQYFNKALEKECIAFIAKKDDTIVSAALLILSERPTSPSLRNGLVGEVMSVYTRPEYRNKGICTKLMTNMIKYGKTRGIDRIDLSATTSGCKVYKKVGFTVKKNDYIDMRFVF